MVLSGFCLFLPVCKSKEALQRWHWKSYAIRRFRRITPPYYAAIIYTTLLPVVLTAFFHLLHKKQTGSLFPLSAVRNASYLHSYAFPLNLGGHQRRVLVLGLEAQFYVVFPLVIAGFMRLRSAFHLCNDWNIGDLPNCGRFSRATNRSNGGRSTPFFVYDLFLGRWMQFAAGMLAAYTVAHYRKNGLLWSGRKEQSRF